MGFVTAKQNSFLPLSKLLHLRLLYHCKNYKEVNERKSWVHPLLSTPSHPLAYQNRYTHFKHAPMGFLNPHKLLE